MEEKIEQLFEDYRLQQKTLTEVKAEILNLFNVSQQRELFKCDKVCDWYSVGHQFNGHQECRTCGKQKEF